MWYVRGEGGYKESDTPERRYAQSRLSFSLLCLRVPRPCGFLSLYAHFPRAFLTLSLCLPCVCWALNYALLNDVYSVLLIIYLLIVLTASFSGVPSNIRLADVRKDLTNTDHVISIHKTHVWSITTGKTILSAHLVVGMCLSNCQLLFYTLLRPVLTGRNRCI